MARIEGWGHTDGRWSDGDRAWTVRAYWGVVDGRAECVGLGLWKGCAPTSDGHYDLLAGGPDAIRTTDLRGIPVATLIAKLRSAALARDKAFRAGVAELLSATNDETLGQLQALPDRLGSPRRGRYPDDHWSTVAKVYEEAWQGRDDPTAAVAEHFDLPHSTAAKHVARARDLGLLPRLGQGRPGTASRRSRKKAK